MDRPDDLRKLLQSLGSENRVVDQLVIVDASDPPVKDVCASFPDLPLDYIRVFPPSLAMQRNAGMAQIRPEITVAGYLDDDIVVEPDATEQMVKFWENASDEVGGASFSIINQPVLIKSFIRRFFLMDTTKPGQVLSSGFSSQIPYVTETIETAQLYGGATVWRRSVIDAYTFDEWFLGHGYYEDVDYSYRVGLKHRLFVVAEARLWHFSRPIAEGKHYDLGRQQIFNRLYFVRKVGGFNMLAVMWGLFGQVLQNLYVFIRRSDQNSLCRLRGNLAALMGALLGRKNPYGGHYK